MNPLRKITDTEKFMRLHDAGQTAREIAKVFGCTERTVERQRKELGLAKPQPRVTPERLAKIKAMLDDGWSLNEITRTEGMRWASIKRHFPDAGWDKRESREFSDAVRKFNEIRRAA